MGRWGDYSKAAKSGGGNGRYVKLQDGEHIKFAVTDAEPGKEITHWKDGAKVAETTPGAERNEKIVLCVWDLDQSAMRILKLTPKTFRELSERVEEFGEGRSYRVKRYKDQKGFVAYAVDQIDRLDVEIVERIAREAPIKVLDENDVWPLELAAEPAPPKPVPPKSRDPRQASRVSAMPPDDMPQPDGDAPF